MDVSVSEPLRDRVLVYMRDKNIVAYGELDIGQLAHSKECRCENCLAWWAARTDMYYGPFSREEILAYTGAIRYGD